MKTIESDWDREEREALKGLEREVAALQVRHAGDPPVDLLRAAREGVLPDELQARVSSHLEHSAWSRTLARDLDELQPGLTAEDADRLLGRVTAGARREQRAGGAAIAWRPLLAFGSLAAAIFLFAVLPNWRAPARVDTARTIDTPTPVSPSPAPPAMVLALSAPELRVSLTALQYRGSPANNPLLADLKAGFAAFGNGDFREAARQLDPLAPRYPQSVEVFFYLGVSRLFLNDHPGAQQALGTAERVADEAFAPDVAWYLAIAEERLGNRAAARARLDALCRAGGTRAAAACEAAPKLQ